MDNLKECYLPLSSFI